MECVGLQEPELAKTIRVNIFRSGPTHTQNSGPVTACQDRPYYSIVMPTHYRDPLIIIIDCIDR